MTDQRPERRDARCCPDCGARGILPLAQPRTRDGSINNPLMICPVCEVEFRADGARWLGVFPPTPAYSESDSEAPELLDIEGGPPGPTPEFDDEEYDTWQRLQEWMGETDTTGTES